MEPDQKLRFAGGATLLGAAPDRGGLQEALARAPALVCADGGANDLPAGMEPEAVIGDLDSLRDAPAWRRRLGDRLIHVSEQYTTDLEKCLLRVDAEFLLCAGFLGGRIDHELAALHALVTDPRPVALIGGGDVVVSAGLRLSLALEPGDRVSVFPMRRVRAGHSTGLRWPLDGLTLEAAGLIGASNEATGPVALAFERPGAVVILPRARLDAAIAGLLTRAR